MGVEGTNERKKKRRIDLHHLFKMEGCVCVWFIDFCLRFSTIGMIIVDSDFMRQCPGDTSVSRTHTTLKRPDPR